VLASTAGNNGRFCWNNILLTTCTCKLQLVHQDWGEDVKVNRKCIIYTVYVP